MIEAIQVAAMDPAMAGQAGPQGTGGLSHATPYDVRDFAAALERSGGASGPQQVGGTPQVADITPAQPAATAGRAERETADAENRFAG